MNISDGLGGVSEQNGVHAVCRRSGNMRLGIIEERDLIWLHAKTLARQRIDAALRLLDPLLMEVDDEVDHQGPGPLRGMFIKNEKGHISGGALPGMGEASHQG